MVDKEEKDQMKYEYQHSSSQYDTPCTPYPMTLRVLMLHIRQL